VKIENIVLPIFGAVGILMLVGAGYAYHNTNTFLKKSLKAEGTVIELMRSRSKRRYTNSSGSVSRSSKKSYAPLVEFQTDDGNTVEFVSSSSSNPPAYGEGDRVEVLYDPWEPTDAKINNFFSLWGLSGILGFMGAIFSAVSLGCYGVKVWRA